MITDKLVESFLMEIFESVYHEELTMAEIWDDFLTEAQSQSDEEDGEDDVPPDMTVQSFESAGVLTNNKGIVLSIGSQEFQLTIVRSR